MLRNQIMMTLAAVIVSSSPATAYQSTTTVSLKPLMKARIELAQGNPKVAVAMLCKIISQNPNDLETRRYLVEALIKSGAAEQASIEMQGLVKAGLRAPQDFCLLADSYRYAGHYSSALLNYQEALNIDPSFASAWSGMAFAYYASGSSGMAVKACKLGLAKLADRKSRAALLKTMDTVQQTVSTETQISSLPPNQQ